MYLEIMVIKSHLSSFNISSKGKDRSGKPVGWPEAFNIWHLLPLQVNKMDEAKGTPWTLVTQWCNKVTNSQCDENHITKGDLWKERRSCSALSLEEPRPTTWVDGGDLVWGPGWDWGAEAWGYISLTADMQWVIKSAEQEPGRQSVLTSQTKKSSTTKRRDTTKSWEELWTLTSYPPQLKGLGVLLGVLEGANSPSR